MRVTQDVFYPKINEILEGIHDRTEDDCLRCDSHYGWVGLRLYNGLLENA